MLTEAKAAASQAVGLDQLLTTNEVVRLLRVSRVTLWEWRRKGLVPAPIKVGLSRAPTAGRTKHYFITPRGPTTSAFIPRGGAARRRRGVRCRAPAPTRGTRRAPRGAWCRCGAA